MRCGISRYQTLVLVSLVTFAGIIATYFLSSAAPLVMKSASDKQKRQEVEIAMDRAAENLMAGRNLGDRPNFPDTPYGRQLAVSYDLMVTADRLKKNLDSQIEKTNFDWVMSSESMATKASVERSLLILSKTRMLVNDYYSDLDVLYSSSLAKIQAEAAKDREAKEYLDRLMISPNGPKSSLAIHKKTKGILNRIHDSIEQNLNLLLVNAGKYRVLENGTIGFFRQVPTTTIEEYNAYCNALNVAVKQLSELQE